MAPAYDVETQSGNGNARDRVRVIAPDEDSAGELARLGKPADWIVAGTFEVDQCEASALSSRTKLS